MPEEVCNNPDIPEPGLSSIDGTFTEVTIAANGSVITVHFYSGEQAQAFVDAYNTAYKVEGSNTFYRKF